MPVNPPLTPGAKLSPIESSNIITQTLHLPPSTPLITSPLTPAPSPTPYYTLHHKHSVSSFYSSSPMRPSSVRSASNISFPSATAQDLFESSRAEFIRLNEQEKKLFLEALVGLCERSVVSHILSYVEPLLKKDPFTVLPNEISLRILSYIDDPKSLARASQVSRLWYLILSDDLTWKALCKSHHYRRLSAALTIPHDRSLSIVSPGTGLSSDMVAENNFDDLAEAYYNPEASRQAVPTSYRSYFKHQYMLNTAWASGGRVAARYVISCSGVVTSLLMVGKYIITALDNSKIYVFREDGRMLRSLFGHVMGVWALTLHEDTLVSGGCDRDVRVWDLRTGNCLQILRGHTSTVRCLQMVDAETAVSGSRDTTIRIWDIKNGVCKGVLTGHEHSVRCLEVVGDICVSGSYDFTAKIWRISDGTLLHTLNGHFSQIYSLAFDGIKIATGSLDTSVKIWDVKTGRCLSTLQGHTSLVGHLQMKGDTLVTGGSDGALRVWDLKKYSCVHRLAAHDNSVTSLQFDDNRIVSGGSDGRVRVWDINTGLHVRDLSMPFDSVWRVSFKDENVVILASRNNKIHMELTSFSPPEEIDDPSPDPYRSRQPSPTDYGLDPIRSKINDAQAPESSIDDDSGDDFKAYEDMDLT